MATYCPNPACERKLKITDWKQTCPACGTNILYYKLEERLMEEADRVEIASAAFQKKADRAKAACFGSKWAIARFVMLFLPLGMLFLPLGKLITDAPFIERTTTLNAISVVTGLMGFDFGAILSLVRDPLLSAAFVWLLLAIVGFVLVIVSILAGAATSFLLLSPKGFTRAVLFSLLGAGFSAFSAVAYAQFGAAAGRVFPGMFVTTLSFGLILVEVAFLAILGINVVIRMMGEKAIKVAHKQCWISGFPEEEVHEALAQGLTLADMRARRDAEEAANATEEAADTAEEVVEEA